MVQVFEEDPASRVVELFAQGVHRVVLFNKSSEMVAICSQSDVVRYLSKNLHMGEMKQVGNKSLTELGYTSSVVVEKIDRSSTVLSALRIMIEKKVSALAVVDSGTGRLEGNFSASDLAGLYFERFPALLDTIEDFLNAHSAKSLNPIVGLPSSSLVEIVRELTEQGLHHLWVVDEFVPVGIISLTDVMRVATA